MMSFWSRMPLLGRLLITAGIGLVAASALILYSVIRQEAEASRGDLQATLQEEIATLPHSLAEDLVIGDFAAVQQTLNRKVNLTDISRLDYTDASGATLTSIEHEAERPVPAWFMDWADLHDLIGKASVTIGGRHYGDVDIFMTAQGAGRHVWRHITSGIEIIALVTVLDFIAIWLVLRSSLRSVHALSMASASVGQGDLAVHVVPSGSPEVRNTTQAFNQMTQAVLETRQRLLMEKERLEVTLASIGDAVIATDRESRVTYLNPVAEQLTGWSREEAMGRPLQDVFKVVNEFTRETVDNPIDKVFKEGRVAELADHTILVARSGLEHPIADSAAPIRVGKGGEISGAVLVFRDQTDERELYNLMRLSGSVFQHAQEGIMITDSEAIIINVNPAFTELTGYTPEEALGHRASLLSSGLNPPSFYADMWATILETGHWRGEIWNRRRDGELFCELLTITAVPSETEGRGHYVGVFSDITELKSQQQHLERIAHYDALTQLPNRVLLADRLHIALAQARRLGTLLAVCYLDLDGFKPVNDQYGHEAGDRLLIDLSQRLTMAMRAGDTVARLGGDEFVLLLSGLHDVDECRSALDRLLRTIAKPYDVKGQPVEVSASVGVSLFPNDDTDPDTLLRHADQAMYAAKEGGRNRYHLFDPEHDRRARAHREAFSRIEEALEEKEFILYYQPKVDMRHGRVVGAEALIRWIHPLRGLLPPAEFLPIIENSNFSVQLDEWCIEQALTQMEIWSRQGLRLPVSVNISARHLQQKDMTSRLAAALNRHPSVPPSDFELEILETSALDDILHATSLITECQRLGVRFALDDFGTGYSSLSYFKRLPAETLKIDQSFVRDMLRDTEDLAIVEGVIGLAEAFNRKVIAEGVETEAHGILLMQLGCNLAQGYGIARPMPADALPAWVAAWKPPASWADAANTNWQRQDLPLLVAEFDHRVWLENFVTWAKSPNVTSSPVMPEDETCPFERWLGGTGQERYGENEAFRSVCSLQRQAQALAHEIVILKQAGKIAEANKQLEALALVSERVMTHLHQLPRAA